MHAFRTYIFAQALHAAVQIACSSGSICY